MARQLRYCLLTLGLLGPVGCGDLDLATVMSGEPARQVSLHGGDIVVQAPEGYCLDNRATKPRIGFALLAPCAAISGSGAYPSFSAVVTIQAGETGSAAVTGEETKLLEFLGTRAGGALLSASGQAVEIDIRQGQSAENLVRVFFTDAGQPPVAGTQSSEWRAFTDIKSRLVTVSLRGMSNETNAQSAGRVLIDQLLNALIQSNEQQDDSAS